MKRRPRSPYVERLLDFWQSIYMDASNPAELRLWASTLVAQSLGLPVDVLVAGPNVWRDALAHLRFRTRKAAKENGKPRKKRKQTDLQKELAKIRSMQNEGKQ